MHTRKISKPTCCTVAASLLALGSSLPAQAHHCDAITARLDSLERQIAMLDQSDQQTWLNKQRVDEVRAITREVLADAATRSSFQDQASTVGYQSGFYITDPDNRFRLRISGFLQTRWMYDHQSGPGVDGHVAAFDLRRARLKFDGHVIDERIGFVIGGSFDRGGVGAMELSDGFLRFDVSDAVQIRTGRMKPRMLREDGISAKRLPLIERSLIRAAFGEGRHAGADITWTGDHLRLTAGVFDDMAGLSDANAWRARGRVEWLASGSWRNARDATGFRGDDTSLMFGIGGGYLDGRQLPGAGMPPEANTVTWSADVNWRTDGWSVLAAIVGSQIQTDSMADQNPIGAVLQGGVFVCDQTELTARYEWGDADDGSADLSMATIGINHYFAGHVLKFGLDFGYAFDQVGAFWASDGAGVRADALGEDGQFVIRSQLQLLF